MQDKYMANVEQHMQLMHAVLALTAMHIRSLEGVSQRPSTVEIYHWQQTLAQFGQKVAPRINKNDADAMLATATLINGIAFAMVEATDPRQSWPLSSNANDLQWLSLQRGIELIFQATQPLHDESVLKDLFKELDEVELAVSCGLGGLPPSLTQLCQITTQSTAENNRYYAALEVLAPLLQLECTAETLITHLGFIGSMRPEYVSLLRIKDHRALLILSYWYATICSFECWWTNPRSRMECTSICMYLENHADYSVRELLPFPAQACGYSLRSILSFTGERSPQSLTPCHLM